MATFRAMADVTRHLRECLDDPNETEENKRLARRLLRATGDPSVPKEVARVHRRAASAHAVQDYSVERQLLLAQLNGLRNVSPSERAAMASLPTPQLRKTLLHLDPTGFRCGDLMIELMREKGHVVR